VVISDAHEGAGVCRAASAPEPPLVTSEHATRLALWGENPWTVFARAVAGTGILLHLVGLLQSAIHMLGRVPPGRLPGRGTFHTPRLARAHSPLGGAGAVNNVSDVFTPAGGAYALALALLAAAVLQRAAAMDCVALLQVVTRGVKRTIREANVPGGLRVRVGEHADLVLMHGCADAPIPSCTVLSIHDPERNVLLARREHFALLHLAHRNDHEA
jgi:hypothetical protein